MMLHVLKTRLKSKVFLSVCSSIIEVSSNAYLIVFLWLYVIAVVINVL